MLPIVDALPARAQSLAADCPIRRCSPHRSRVNADLTSQISKSEHN
jgi:hypothetical protein